MEKIGSEMISEITQCLVRAYNPKTIYLFGSYAWGNPDSSSDIDFFVILDRSDLDAAERIRIGLRAMKNIHADVELLVYTAEEVAEKISHPSTLASKVISKGIKVYEAA